MGKIFCLMGKSSTGKDTIFERLKDDEELNVQPVILYTTRPKRSYEEEGVQYHFISKEELAIYDSQGYVIEKRCYETIDGPWYYATIDDGQIDLDNHNYIVIVTLEAYNNLRKYYNNEQILPIYIEVEDGIRLERAIKREQKQIKPKYEEMCRRFLADSKDFSEENLYKSKVNRRYTNYDLDNCIKEIRRYIDELQ